MPQLRGHVVTDDGQRIGIVSAVSTVEHAQPDVAKIRFDEVTGRPKRYVYEDGAPVLEPQAPVELPVVTVKWEDGTESQLTETVDAWEVLGSVKHIPAGESDPEIHASHDRAVAAALADVKAYADELRAAPAVSAADDVNGDDVIVVVRDAIGAGDSTGAPAPAADVAPETPAEAPVELAAVEPDAPPEG